FYQNLNYLKFKLLDQQFIFKSISEAIQSYNEIRVRKYLTVYNINDLKKIIEVSLSEFKNFYFNEGYLDFVKKILSKNNNQSTVFLEDTLQKTLKISLENALLNNGIRNTDIIRELELYDGKRLDLYVRYGFL